MGREFYTIKDMPRPVNIYGKTKVEGEAAVQQVCAQSYIIRTSWVFGQGKNSFLCTVHDDLRAGKRVRAIDDIWSSTTYAADLVARVLEIKPGIVAPIRRQRRRPPAGACEAGHSPASTAPGSMP